MLMFAYGSNLNLAQMAQRCPKAKPLGWLRLKNWRLVFRGVADCIPEDGAVCYGGVWRITSECEAALDAYEGCQRGMYRREYIPIKHTPMGETDMLIYCMNSTGIAPPSEFYLNVIRKGYKDFSMPKAAYAELSKALQSSWDDKAPSHIERQRRTRNGRPRLAPPPAAVPATGK